MTIVYGSSFLKSAKKLPANSREKLAYLISLFQKNPFNPLLHTKSLSGSLSGLYSFRITRDWRVIFQFVDTNTTKLLLVGHRKDIYQKFQLFSFVFFRFFYRQTRRFFSKSCFLFSKSFSGKQALAGLIFPQSKTTKQSIFSTALRYTKY